MVEELINAIKKKQEGDIVDLSLKVSLNGDVEGTVAIVRKHKINVYNLQYNEFTGTPDDIYLAHKWEKYF